MAKGISKRSLKKAALRCAECNTEKMRKGVCGPCHVEIVRALGQKIRELQGKVMTKDTMNALLKEMVVHKHCQQPAPEVSQA